MPESPYVCARDGITVTRAGRAWSHAPAAIMSCGLPPEAIERAVWAAREIMPSGVQEFGEQEDGT